MPKIDCLETANKNYSEKLSKDDIEEFFKKLNKRARVAQNAGENVAETLQNYSKELMKLYEYNNKQKLLRSIKNSQNILDTLEVVKEFLKRGHTPEKAVARAITARLAGSTWKAARNRDNTWTKRLGAESTFYRELVRDLGELMPIFNSKSGQAELAQAMYDRKANLPVEGDYGRMADIIIKHQDNLYNNLEKQGVAIVKREDRIAPNIHDAERILELSKDERKEAMERYGENGTTGKVGHWGDPMYEYAFQRWSEAILQEIDHDKVFTENGFDKNDPKEVEAFQRKAFDELVNRGKASQENVNFANKFQQGRVYSWKDGASLVRYNDRFGNGSIQDAMLNELSGGFAKLEVIKDWGTTPEALIGDVLEEVDKDPALNQRLNKDKEKDELIRLVRDISQRPEDFTGSFADFTNAVLAWETISKLGNVVFSSIPDLVQTAKIARQSGFGLIHTVSNVIKKTIAGISKNDAEILYKVVDNSKSAKLGQLSRYFVNPYAPNSIKSNILHFAMKFNGLHFWDSANRAEAASMISQSLAYRRKFKWDELRTDQQELLQSYNINADDWNVIRQGNIKIGSRGKEFITPDSIQHLSDDIIRSALEKKGIENITDIKIQDYKDSVERKLLTYFRDRQDHVIIVPDVIEQRGLRLGVSPTALKGIPFAVVRGMVQFKSFGVAQLRRQVLTTLREGGATTNFDMFNPLNGKSNWIGVGALGASLMIAEYVNMSLKNAAQGLSPPDPRKLSTWGKMSEGSLGILGRLLQIDYTHPYQSLTKQFEGAAFSDTEKLVQLGYNLYKDTKEGRGYKRTKKSAYNFVKSNIPIFNTFFTKWGLKHFVLNAWEDAAQPGKRQKDLRQIEKDTGAKQLF